MMYTVASPGGDEKPIVLLDPNKLSEDGTVSFFLFLFFFLLTLLSHAQIPSNQIPSPPDRSGQHIF